jgi:hypothetical protein
MNTLLTGIILLLLVGVGIYVLTLATRLVKAVEKIANQNKIAK